MSQEAKPRRRINSISHDRLLDKHLIKLKGKVWLKERGKRSFSNQPFHMGLYPMVISQSKHKFPSNIMIVFTQ